MKILKLVQRNTVLGFIFALAIPLAQVGIVSASPGHDKHAHMGHAHMPIALPEGSNHPRLSMTIHKDPMSGYNLELALKHYNLVPPPYHIQSMGELMAATTGEDGKTVEGHAHLYVNGEKIQRVYSKYLHLPGKLFRKGVNEITVTLNNHGHLYWQSGKEKIMAKLFIDPDKKESVVRRLESFPVIATTKGQKGAAK